MQTRIFLDSGAYSAWQQKKQIDLQAYIDFIYNNRQYIEVYANLDDIEDPEKTWVNQREMEAQGLSPLPVYHVGEDEKFLKMALEYEYFAVGGMALKSGTVRESQFDMVFRIICPKSNYYKPTHKIHGFGLAAPNLMLSYPWYSVDTTSWVQYGRYGLILVPKAVGGIFHYGRSPYTIAISERSKATGDARHFKNLPEIEKKAIQKYAEKRGCPIGESRFESGKEVVIEPGLINDYRIRDRLNTFYFLDLEKNQKEWPWAWQTRHGFF
jgi:hypothetical protein